MNEIATVTNGSIQQRRDKSAVIAEFRAGGNSYKLECLTSNEDIHSVKPEWQALERSNDEPFIYFQSFDWCYQWCINKFEHDNINQGTELSVYVLRRDDVIAMIWPMMKTSTRLNTKILTFLTHPLAQYANVLVDKKRVNEKTGRKVWKLIRKHAKVDAVTINLCPSGSFLEAIIYGFGFVERSHAEASILDLTGFGTWNDHYASLSRNQRKQRNRWRKKLAEQGDVAFKVSIGGSKDYSEHVYRALEMKQVWLRNTGRKPGVLAETETGKFLTALTGTDGGTCGNPQGAVTHALCINGRPIAIEIGMVMGQHYYSYLGAFDWAWKDFSPGKVQIEAAQKWAKHNGLEKFDFLGDPSDYKKQWADVKQPLLSCSIPMTAKGLLYCAIWKSLVRPKLKTAYKNMDSDKRKLIFKVTSSFGRTVGNRDKAQSVDIVGTKKNP